VSVKRESGMVVRSSNKTRKSKTQSMHADVILIQGAETDREEEEGQEEKRDANTTLEE